VAIGDVNGDGAADLVVGAPTTSAAGTVYLFLSSVNTGLQGSNESSTMSTADARFTIGGPLDDQSFGNVVAVGDVTGDFFADVVVAAPDLTSGAGTVYLFQASSSGLVGGLGKPIPNVSSDSALNTIVGPEGSDLGYSLAMGDVNGDGFLDLVVGANSASTVYVFQSSADGLVGELPELTSTDAIVTLTGGSNANQFGYAVAVADVNGDGFADVLVGTPHASPHESENAGSVFGYVSAGGTGLTGALNDTNATLSLFGANGEDQLGFSVALADLTGDGFADVVVGDINLNSSTGVVYLFQSTPTASVGSTGTPSTPLSPSDATTTLAGTGGSSMFGVWFANAYMSYLNAL
jgi:hypothetical protein